MSGPYYRFKNTLGNDTSAARFEEINCTSSTIVKVACKSLECGTRPQAIQQVARYYFI